MNNPMRNRNWIFRTRWPAAGAGLALAIMLVLAVLATGSAQAQTFTTLHSFNGTDGSSPYAGLVQATDGNLYGTTGGGGANSYGTVFKITPSGTLTTLYSFCQQTGCADGTFPVAALVQATNGSFYGTADTYGVGDLGTVFEITPGGALTTLYSFNGPNGANPYMESLIQATDGNLYGTTRIDGTNGGGTLFKITPSGTLTTLYNFCVQSGCTDGEYPFVGVVEGTDGNFYGTTSGGGPNTCALGTYTQTCGTVFKITPSGTLTTLHSFGGADGWQPDAALVQAADGNLYSTTRFGGANNAGTVFKITPSGTLTTLYSFCSQSGCTDGADPTGALIQATDGNFYGTTQSGGVNNDGTVFTITTNGVLTALHSFDGTDGATPWGAELLQDTHGEFYGTTSAGGTYGYGTVFSLSVGLGPFVETLPTSGNVGVAVEILGTNLTGATSVSFNGTAATFEVASNSEITTTVPTGATTGYVTVTTPSGTLTSNVVFRVGTGTLVPTTTTLTSSPNPSNYGQAVTLTATVTSSAGAPPNGEAVSFMNGTTPLKTGTLSGGSASITISTLPVGTDAITAVYAGDPNFRGSTSNTVSQVVLGIAASTPAFSPTPGTYSTPQSVTLADASPGVTIYYTTNGSTPTTASTPYSGAIKVSTTTTIEAIAAGNGYAPSPVAVGVYTITSPAAMPIFSPFPSNYTAPETVSLSDMSSGVTIYYTLDGSTPSATNGTAYTAPIKLIATTTIKAIATGGSYGSSAVNSGTYTLQAATPSFSPMPSTYAPPKTVTLSDFTPGVTIYYTLDGSTPSSTNGSLYTGPITLTNSTTIKAIAVGAGISPSAIASGTFTLQAMTPSFSPMPSTYATPKTVTLYDATSGVTVYYTLDGSAPSSTNGSVYTGPITLTKSTTIQAIAIGTGISPSAVASGTYTLQAMIPGFTPMPSSYTRQVNVTLYDATSSATIYYTTDGSTPSASNGTPYAGPMTVTTTTTIKAVAIGTGYNPSAVATGTYTINP